MARKLTVSLILLAVFLIMSVPASARLAGVGPGNPANGFPLWYQDTSGIALDLPTPPLGDGINAPTQIYDPPVVGNPFSARIGFGTEAMYWSADANIVLPGGGRARLILALEAAFAQEIARDGDQIVFSRVRIRIDIPPTGAGQTYTVIHPYGTDVFTNVTAGVRGINSTVDIGICPGNFTAAATDGQIGPFLRQLSPPPPAGWYGDGATQATVIGSPFRQNFFRIEGPDIGGPGVDSVETNLFVVSGHRFAGGVPLSLTANRLSFSRDAANTTIEIFAEAAPGSTLTATIPGVATPVTLNPGVGQLKNTFFGRVTFPSTVPLPTSITLVATRQNQTEQLVIGPPTDVVTITEAVFDTTINRLVIRATSSDQVANPVLTVTDPTLQNLTKGQLVNGRLTTNIGAPPSMLTVSSDGGGSTTVLVTSR